MKKVNRMKGVKISISEHALERYIVRTEIMSQRTFDNLMAAYKSGDKQAAAIINKHRSNLLKKVSGSVLSKIYGDKFEERRETGKCKNRCVFIVKNNGHSIKVITSFLQGGKNDFWRVENR